MESGTIIMILEAEIRLPGCRSLKEKRSRLSGIGERMGKNRNAAVLESGYQDKHDRSLWTICVLAGDQASLSRTASGIEQTIVESIDGELVELRKEQM